MTTKVNKYQLKLRISGNVYEFYQYEKPIFRGYKQKHEKPKTKEEGTAEAQAEGNTEPSNIKDCTIDFETGEIIDKRLSNRGRSNARARRNLCEIVRCNFTKKSKFITLTFEEAITDVAEANKIFDRFMKRLKRQVKEPFKWVVVVEFQKNGRVHYHMLSDIGYIKKDKLQAIWDNGFVGINRIDRISDLGKYITKYMTKAQADKRMYDKKVYRTSQGMEKPIELLGDQAEYFLQAFENEGKKIGYLAEYPIEFENPHTGEKVEANKVVYKEYVI